MNNYISHDISVNKVLGYSSFQLRAVRYLAKMYNRYGICDPSQSTIAEEAGTCRKTANETIKKCKEDAVLLVVPRYFDTSLHFPGPLLTDIKYRDKLKVVIPELNGFPVFKLFQSAFGYTNILRDTNRETLRVATGYYPSAKNGDSMAKHYKTDEYIAPYVAEITDIALSPVEKHILSLRWSQTIVSRALYFLRKRPKAPRTFAYLDGICDKTSRGMSDNSRKTTQPKLRFDAHPDSGESRAVSLSVEAEEKATIDFHLARQHLVENTSVSSLYDAVKCKEFGLPVKDIALAAQEVIAITKVGTTIEDFISCCSAVPEWKSKRKLEKSINDNDSWSLRKLISRDTKQIEALASEIIYQESDEYLFVDAPTEILESVEQWEFEKSWIAFGSASVQADEKSWTEYLENTSIPHGNSSLENEEEQ